MAWNKVQIVSLALGLLGKGPIESIDAAGDYAAAAGAHYDLLLPAELCKYNWRFATAIVQLARTVETPLIDEWLYVYQLPSDYLTVWKMYPQTKYQIYENKKLYANVDTLKIEYRFMPNVVLLPAYFVQYFATRLAQILAVAVAENKTYADTMEKMANTWLLQALSTDAQAHPNQSTVNNPFQDVRY